jgi:TolA-binding protein
MPRALVALIGVACAAGIAGCAARADLEQVQNDQFQLRAMVASQNQQIQSLQNQVRRLSDLVEEVRHAGGAAGGGKANEQIANLEDRLSNLEAKVQSLEAAPTSVAPPASVPGAPPGEAAVPAAVQPWRAELDKELAGSISGSGAKVYREALVAMRDGNYGLAAAKFSALSKKYPKSELVEPAEYFAASALFESGKYDRAILQFNDLAMRFPKSRFASAALLRQAQAFLKLSPPDRIDARLTLQKLLSEHADSAEATQARDMMKDLES